MAFKAKNKSKLNINTKQTIDARHQDIIDEFKNKSNSIPDLEAKIAVPSPFKVTPAATFLLSSTGSQIIIGDSGVFILSIIIGGLHREISLIRFKNPPYFMQSISTK